MTTNIGLSIPLLQNNWVATRDYNIDYDFSMNFDRNNTYKMS